MFRRIYFGLCSFRGNQSQTHRIRNLQSNEGVKSSELCDIKKVETEFKQDADMVDFDIENIDMGKVIDEAYSLVEIPLDIRGIEFERSYEKRRK